MIDRATLKAAGFAFLAVMSLSLLALAQRDDRDGAGSAAESGRNIAGEFDYYTLVMSWSPTHCSTDEGERDAQQCGRRDGRRYAFVLHGLWPQYETGYPESCRIKMRPYVPQDVIDGMLDIMPNSRLVIHEYRTHGTCSGLDPRGYYEASRRLFDKVNIPSRFINPFESQFVTPDDFVSELIDANDGLTADMVAVTCGGPGNRLRDVRVCFTRSGEFRACGSNEEQGRLCRAARLHVPPVRSTKSGPSEPEDRRLVRPSQPSAGPKVIEAPRPRN
jgi:ribonuclease T2